MLRKLTLCLSILFLFLSCSKENEETVLNENKTSQSLITESGFDLTPFAHLGEEVLDALRAIDFPPATRAIDQVTMSPNSTWIAGTGENRTFTVIGINAANNSVITARLLMGVEYARSPISWDIPRSYGTAVIYFEPYNDPYGDAKVFVIESQEENNEPKPITALIQYPVNATFLTNLFEYDYILARGGGNIEITKTGTYPSAIDDFVEFRASSTQDPNTVLGYARLEDPDTDEVYLNIPPNDDDTRTITIYYRFPGSAWIELERFVQRGADYTQMISDWMVVPTLEHPITAKGGTAVIALNGDYVDVPVRIWAMDSWGEPTTLVEDAVVKGELPTDYDIYGLSDYDGAVAVKIPAYENNGWPYNPELRYNSPKISYQYLWAQAFIDNEWTFLGYSNGMSNELTQPWYRLTLSESMGETTSTLSSWPITVSGYWENDSPQIKDVRLYVVTDPENPTLTLMNQLLLDPIGMNNPSYTVEMPVGSNTTNQKRDVYLMLSVDAGQTIEPWFEGWTGDGIVTQVP